MNYGINLPKKNLYWSTLQEKNKMSKLKQIGMNRFTYIVILLGCLFSSNIFCQKIPEIQLFAKVGVANLDSKSDRYESMGSSYLIGTEYRTGIIFSKFYGLAGLSIDFFQHKNFMQGGGFLLQNGVDFPVISHTTKANFIGGGGYIGLGREFGKISLNVFFGLSHLFNGNYTKIEVEHIGNEVISVNSPYENLSFDETITSLDNSFRLADDNKRLEKYVGFEIGCRIKNNLIIGVDITRYPLNWQFDEVETMTRRFTNDPIQEVGRFSGDDFARQRTSMRLSIRFML